MRFLEMARVARACEMLTHWSNANQSLERVMTSDTEECNEPGLPSVVITLVHGTFASDAPWTNSDIAMRAALKEAGHMVAPFNWSGKNSHCERRSAAVRLTEHLKDQIALHPGADHWIIAHSHGGNVALHAVHRIGIVDDSRRIPIITLATPFIHAQSSFLPSRLFRVLGQYGGLCVGASIPISLSGYPSWWIWVLLPPILVAIPAYVFGFRLMMALANEIPGITFSPIDEALREIHAPTVEASDVTVVRMPRDEASGLLTTAQFISWASDKLAALFRAKRFFNIIACSVLGLTFVDTFLGGIDLIHGVILAIFAVCNFFLGSATVGAVSAPFIFGRDGFRSGWLALIWAESSPPGNPTYYQIASPLFDSDNRLSHTMIYEDEIVINLVKWTIKNAGQGS